jgi:hypothetical protein
MALLAGLLAPVAPASAASPGAPAPEIRDIAVVEKKGRLLAFASLSGGFTPKVFEAIRSGVTTRFTFEIALMRDRPLIYDTEVFRRTIVHQVKYDTLKKAYTFTSKNGSDEKLVKVTKDRKVLMDWMREINGHPIAQVRDMDPNQRYYLQARANLNSVSFSFPFNYMLFFLENKTAWHASPTFGAKGM